MPGRIIPMWGFRRAANYTPPTPLSLLARKAYVCPQRPAVIHGELRIQLEVCAAGGSRRRCYQ
jgi:hypothetical protein